MGRGGQLEMELTMLILYFQLYCQQKCEPRTLKSCNVKLYVGIVFPIVFISCFLNLKLGIHVSHFELQVTEAVLVCTQPFSSAGLQTVSISFSPGDGVCFTNVVIFHF